MSAAASGFRRSIARTALVVAEDEALRAEVASALEDDGFEVIGAGTLVRARYVLFESRHPVGVVVLSLRMPDGDGESLLVEMYEKDAKNVPTVVLSPSRDAGEGAAERWGIAFVPAPLDVHVLVAAVGVAFEGDVRPHERVVAR